jgi:hypothetical protein
MEIPSANVASARVPVQSQCRQTKQETRNKADKARGGNGHPVWHRPLVHQDCRDVSADCVKGTMPQRNLAVVTREHVQPEKYDRVNEHKVELEYTIAANHERQQQSGQHHNADDDEASFVDVHAVHYTLVTKDRPNRPVGLKISTPMINISATVSFSSVPTT